MRAIAFAAVLIAIGVTACTVDAEDPGNLPDVTAEGGGPPDIEVDAATVDITIDTQMVRVPEAEVRP